MTIQQLIDALESLPDKTKSVAFVGNDLERTHERIKLLGVGENSEIVFIHTW